MEENGEWVERETRVGQGRPNKGCFKINFRRERGGPRPKLEFCSIGAKRDGNVKKKRRNFKSIKKVFVRKPKSKKTKEEVGVADGRSEKKIIKEEGKGRRQAKPKMLSRQKTGKQKQGMNKKRGAGTSGEKKKRKITKLTHSRRLKIKRKPNPDRPPEQKKKTTRKRLKVKPQRIQHKSSHRINRIQKSKSDRISGFNTGKVTVKKWRKKRESGAQTGTPQKDPQYGDPGGGADAIRGRRNFQTKKRRLNYDLKKGGGDQAVGQRTKFQKNPSWFPVEKLKAENRKRTKTERGRTEPIFCKRVNRTSANFGNLREVGRGLRDVQTALEAPRGAGVGLLSRASSGNEISKPRFQSQARNSFETT